MASFVLVHGAWHGAWCWDRVKELLEAAREGHSIEEVLAPDLPGHGERAAQERRPITVEDYISAVVTPVQLKRLTEVVLVGHAFAATFLPQVALQIAPGLKRVVFIAGTLPTEGSTPYDELPLAARLTIRLFKASEKGVWFPSFVMQRLLCSDMDGEAAQELLSRLTPDPLQPWRTPVSRNEFVGRFPTTYVLLRRDKNMPPHRQRRYIQSLDSPEVVELDAAHEAMLTHPRELAEILLRYA